LQLPDYAEVFAGGDCAGAEGQSLPPTAQVAYQQGEGIAHSLPWPPISPSSRLR